MGLIDKFFRSRIGVALMVFIMAFYPLFVFYCIFTKATTWNWVEWFLLLVGIGQAFITYAICHQGGAFKYIFKGE